MIDLRTGRIIRREIDRVKISIDKVKSLLDDVDTPDVDKIDIINWIAYAETVICKLEFFIGNTS